MVWERAALTPDILVAYALRPEALPAELEVLLGRSRRIAEWALW